MSCNLDFKFGWESLHYSNRHEMSIKGGSFIAGQHLDGRLAGGLTQTIAHTDLVLARVFRAQRVDDESNHSSGLVHEIDGLCWAKRLSVLEPKSTTVFVKTKLQLNEKGLREV